ncbi:MAG: FtsW/RodA/SpoVE family cell cycle protein [Lachnospiraceae bacterium]
MSRRILLKKRGDNFIKRNSHYDYNLIAIIVLLMCFGLVMLYSTSSYSAQVAYGNDMYYFAKQAVISVLSLGFAVGISFIDYHRLWKLSFVLYISSIIMMILVKTPLGYASHGARRWLNLGPIRIQPAEFAKLAVIIFIPVLIIKIGKNFHGLKAPLIVIAAGGLSSLSAFIFTENLSTAIIIFAITCIIVFVAHPKTLPFILALAGCILVFGIIVLVVNLTASTGGSFRLVRILTWLHPETYQNSGGWQIIQGLYALGSGGFFGKGLGNSTQKLGFVPEAQNDMIFSIVCEELGVFGGLLLIVLFIYLMYRLFYISQNSKDLYGCLMASGIFAHIALQVILNIAVVTNLIPTTGITLPFISYGGTSIVFLMIEMGIALSVSRQMYPKREDLDVWG